MGNADVRAPLVVLAVLAMLLLANLIVAGRGWVAAWGVPGAHPVQRVGHGSLRLTPRA